MKIKIFLLWNLTNNLLKSSNLLRTVNRYQVIKLFNVVGEFTSDYTLLNCFFQNIFYNFKF